MQFFVVAIKEYKGEWLSHRERRPTSPSATNQRTFLTSGAAKKETEIRLHEFQTTSGNFFIGDWKESLSECSLAKRLTFV